MLDLMKLPAPDAERLAYAEGFTGTAELFARLADMQKALGDATAEIVTLREALAELADAAESGADPKALAPELILALRHARSLIQYPEGIES